MSILQTFANLLKIRRKNFYYVIIFETRLSAALTYRFLYRFSTLRQY